MIKLNFKSSNYTKVWKKASAKDAKLLILDLWVKSKICSLLSLHAYNQMFCHKPIFHLARFSFTLFQTMIYIKNSNNYWILISTTFKKVFFLVFWALKPDLLYENGINCGQIGYILNSFLRTAILTSTLRCFNWKSWCYMFQFYWPLLWVTGPCLS